MCLPMSVEDNAFFVKALPPFGKGLHFQWNLPLAEDTGLERDMIIQAEIVNPQSLKGSQQLTVNQCV